MKQKKMRQLMAIMFTDIVGYTALMQEDETKAMKLRSRHRAVFRGLHAFHGGEIIQYYGDGTLSVFKSAVSAAQCALDIQRRLQEGNPVPLRIGIHMGDIVFDKTEVYGSGVNVASRIERLSTSSSILLSGKLNDELKNHSSISTTSMGHFQLKNVSGPVEVFAINNKGIRVPEPFELHVDQKLQPKKIAVLPFVNMSTCDEAFGEGIGEELINGLSKILDLKVSSRTSSFFFKNRYLPLKQIADELKVSYILDGSVRHSNGTVKITAQLLNPHGDYHLWSETWTRKTGNRFDIQEEISSYIVEKVKQYLYYTVSTHSILADQTNPFDTYRDLSKEKLFANK